MVTYEEAKKIALGLHSGFNKCLEYEDAYTFSEEMDVEVDGGDICVILKETGEAINWLWYLSNYSPNPNFKEHEF